MLNFIVEHKYCKCTREIKGTDIYNAMKENKMCINLWNIIEVRKEGF